jgi:unspecific monooxygenase
MAISVFPALALAALTLLSLYKFIIHPLLFHPLRHIPPAHPSIPIFGDLWITYQRYRERNNAVTYAAHLKYGDVVRMGSNELSINCVDNGIRTIYTGGWEKHAWYPQRFGSYG